MSKKIMLLALTTVSAALFALPAAASAGEWEMTPAGGAFTVHSVGNTVLTTHNNETITCTTVTGGDSYNMGSTTTGTIGLTFHGCTTTVLGFKVNCTGAGEPTGTTKTTTLTFTNIYLTDSKTTPGIKITGAGANEHFDTFKCGGVEVVVTGSLIGQLESPCGTASKEHKLLFESTAHGTQKWMQNTLTGPNTDLTATIGGTPRTASLDGTWILTFAQIETVRCV